MAKFKFHPVYEPCLEIRSMYKHYIEWCKQVQTPVHDYDKFKLVIETFNTIMVNKMLHEGFACKFPYNLGIIVIKKLSTTANKFLDYGEWQKTKKVVFRNNHHTNGYRYKVFWHKPKHLKNKVLFSFRFSRDNNRMLAQLLKNKEVDYFEW